MAKLAMAIVGHEADARDATQEALAAIWRGLPGLRDPERFDAWSTRITVHAARRVLRGRGRARVREIAIDPAIEAGDAFDQLRTPEPTEAAERRIALDRAFERLSPDERALLALRHLEERSIEEIAAVFEIPGGTAKSRLFAARRALERALARETR